LGRSDPLTYKKNQKEMNQDSCPTERGTMSAGSFDAQQTGGLFLNSNGEKKKPQSKKKPTENPSPFIY